MALAVDAHGKGTPTLTSPQTESVTLAAGATQLFVSVLYGGVMTVTGVTWNGAALTQLGATSDSGFKQQLWAIKSPASGTHNIVATLSADPSGTGMNIFWASLTGGDTTTGWRTIYNRTSADGTGPGETVVDSVSGDIVVHSAAVVAGTIVFDGGETAQQTDNMFSGGFSGGLSYKSASGANTAVGCTDQVTYGESATAAIPASTTGTDTGAVGASDVVRPVTVTLSIQESG